MAQTQIKQVQRSGSDVASPETISASIQYWAGPLPHPEILKEYDRLVPGSAKQLLDQAIKQSDHRMDLERRVTRSDSKRANWGLASALTVAIGSLGVCAYAIGHSAEWAASILGGGTIASLVYAFIYGTRSRREERIARAKLMAGVDDSK